MQSNERSWTARTWRTLLIISIGVVVVCSLGSQMASRIKEIAAAAASTDWTFFGVAVLVCVAYRLMNAGVWGVVLAAIGRPIPTRTAARMWLQSEACRWLPGPVWSFGSRVVLCGRQGIAASAAGAALGLELALTIASWTLIAVASAAIAEIRISMPFDAWVLWSLVAVAGTVGAGIALMPTIARRLGNKAFVAITRFRQLAHVRLRWGKTLGALLAYVALGLVNGACCWLAVRAVAPSETVPLSAVIAANSIAWLAGFFAFFAPAGLGVREGTLVLLLAPWLPWELGMTAAALWRLAQIVAELACLGMTLPSRSPAARTIASPSLST
jgi:glycosyltransferase 2 family protein